MKFTTFAIFAAAVAAVSAAPTPEAARGDGNWRSHGHKYGGQRKYGHSHKQPHADAASTTDEWVEDEPCVSGVAAPVAANNAVAAAPSASSSSSSAAISSASAVAPSSSADQPAPTPSSTWTPEPEPTPEPKKEEVKVEEPKQEEPPKQEDNKTSNGGRAGQITTYSVTNPDENHGLDAGTVACYTLNRKFSNSDYIAAVRTSEFHIGLCGKTINVCGKAGCADVQIVDSCAGGGCKDLDLSPSAFAAVTGDHTGIYDVTIQGY